MTLYVCTNPQCQTTAGCRCDATGQHYGLRLNPPVQPTKLVCAKCGLPIEGSYVSVFGSEIPLPNGKYHNECAGRGRPQVQPTERDAALEEAAQTIDDIGTFADADIYDECAAAVRALKAHPPVQPTEPVDVMKVKFTSAQIAEAGRKAMTRSALPPVQPPK